MSESSKDSVQRLHEFFATKPDAEEKAWGLIYEFYHHVLTYMEEKNITRADLAKKLGKSRAAIIQMFNKNPNISVLKMVEIADAVGIDLAITTRKKIETMKAGTRAGASEKAAAGSSGRYIAPLRQIRRRLSRRWSENGKLAIRLLRLKKALTTRILLRIEDFRNALIFSGTN